MMRPRTILLALIASLAPLPVFAQGTEGFSRLGAMIDRVKNIIAGTQTATLGVASFIITLMIVIGGFQYLMGQKDAGKKTLTAAVIGLAIILLSSVAVSLTGTVTPAGSDVAGLTASISLIIKWILTIAGLTAVAYTIYAGIQYMTGGSKGAEAAKSQVASAVTGVIIIVLAYAIFNIANSLVSGP